ncbi:hypothetical protein [Methanoregula sp.]|jgi:hypothetical protein|uniref:hypothetical protein n=1 Tax=Methanoregula sp. TaxID=2052170 RepID=UPI003C23C1CD
MVADMILTLEGQHFRRQYLLYIIQISNGNDNHFYIGQTGDNNATTARPAFRRLAAHLGDSGSSTENQVYQYLAEHVIEFPSNDNKGEKFNKKIKQAVEDYLVHSTISMYVYSLQEFPPGIEREVHLANVRKVRLFEKIIIDLFIKHQKKIANKKLSKPPRGAVCPYPDIFKRIESDFKLS